QVMLMRRQKGSGKNEGQERGGRRERKAHRGNPACGSPQHMGFLDLQNIKDPGEIAHKRSAIAIGTAIRLVVSPTGVRDHPKTGGGEHRLLVKPDLTA